MDLHDLDERLSATLESDETLLWWGRPNYRHFRSEAWAAFVFGLIPLVASCGATFATVGVFRQAIVEGEFKMLSALPIAVIPAIGFGWIACSALVTPWSRKRRPRHAFYAVTSKRVLVYGSVGYVLNDMAPETKQILYSFTPEQANKRIFVKRSKHRVDLVLAKEQQGSGRHRSQVQIGILGADDWNGANTAIRQAFTQK